MVLLMVQWDLHLISLRIDPLQLLVLLRVLLLLLNLLH